MRRTSRLYLTAGAGGLVSMLREHETAGGSATMIAARTFLGSTIGKKVVMASTGVVLFGFVLLHMAGNLQLYLGAPVMDEYAVFLREFLHVGGLWIARAVLLACAVLHVWAAASLTMADRGARPVGYREWEARESTVASRTMRWTGVGILVVIVYHLPDLTFGPGHPGLPE